MKNKLSGVGELPPSSSFEQLQQQHCIGKDEGDGMIDVRSHILCTFELLQDAIASIHTHTESKLIVSQSQIVRLQAMNEALQKALMFRDARYAFSVSSCSCLSRHHQMEVCNRDAELKYLKRELISAVHLNYESIPKSELEAILQTREAQLERMASQLDYVNSENQKLIDSNIKSMGTLEEKEMTIQQLNASLQEERATNARLMKSAQIAENSHRFRKRLPSPSPRGAGLPIMAGPTTGAVQQQVLPTRQASLLGLLPSYNKHTLIDNNNTLMPRDETTDVVSLLLSLREFVIELRAETQSLLECSK